VRAAPVMALARLSKFVPFFDQCSMLLRVAGTLCPWAWYHGYHRLGWTVYHDSTLVATARKRRDRKCGPICDAGC